MADRLGGRVVSADSMQAYRGVPIITAQPERPTALVAIWPLSHEGSVGEYAWGGAASTMFWVDPREELVGLLLTQLIPSSSYPLRREMKALTYQALID